MSQSFDSRQTTPPCRPQHKSGLACEECRRRKLRCDRRRPKCSLCETSGVECQTTARPPRGPKRGYLKVLQDRIANLEGLLLQQNNGQKNSPYDASDIETILIDSKIELPSWQLPIMDEDGQPLDICERTKSSNSSDTPSIDGKSGASIPSINRLSMLEELGFDTTVCRSWDTLDLDPKISDLMQADLDQLYFDRIHGFMPILHQSRYFAMRQKSIKAESEVCLQYAMWTLAASVSAHYQSVGHSLYQNTRRLLEELDSKNIKLASTDLQQVQAWLLLAIHEFMCVDFRRGWMSAGRAFRLIQLSWRHGTDGPDSTQVQGDWIESERRRRTFWMAYCLDRFVSMRIESPLTFSETVAIRLPCSERDFQNDQPVLMGFLTEALVSSNSMVVSAFTECIIVATITGRALAHRHQFHVGDMCFNALADFWTQHEWINAMHSQSIEAFSSRYSADMQQTDPMLLFIGLMYRITTLHLYQTTGCFIATTHEEQRDLVLEDRIRASSAAKDIVDLTNKLSSLNTFKVHPLTPIPLSLCVEFLVSSTEFGDSFASELQNIIEAMRSLRSFNNIGRGILHLLEEFGVAEGIPMAVQ